MLYSYHFIIANNVQSLYMFGNDFIISNNVQTELTLNKNWLKGLVYPKIKILSLFRLIFTHPHVDSNP